MASGVMAFGENLRDGKKLGRLSIRGGDKFRYRRTDRKRLTKGQLLMLNRSDQKLIYSKHYDPNLLGKVRIKFSIICQKFRKFQ